MFSIGLTEVGTEDLKKLLGLLHRGEIHCPLNAVELARTGLQNATNPVLNHLRGLGAEAARAVVTAALAERILAERRFAALSGQLSDRAEDDHS